MAFDGLRIGSRDWLLATREILVCLCGIMIQWTTRKDKRLLVLVRHHLSATL